MIIEIKNPNRQSGKVIESYEIELGWVYLKNQEMYLAVKEDDMIIHYQLKNDESLWCGYMRGHSFCQQAKQGEKYRGWRNKECYRLTDDEIENLVKGKVFDFGILD
jgi:hypothetical protein